MRKIGHLDTEEDAQRFVDHLLGVDMEAQVREGREGFEVWVVHHQHLEPARTQLESYRAFREDSRFVATVKEGRRVRDSQIRAEEAHQERMHSARSLVEEHNSLGPIASVLLAISLVVAAASHVGENQAAVHFLFIGNEVFSGQLWRLITPIFIHSGWMHLIFNMWMLMYFGRFLEKQKGSGHFAVLVLVTAVLSNVLQFAVKGPLFGGMSGVLYGLFGYAWAKGRWDPFDGVGVERQTSVLLWVWLFLCYTGLLGSIANYAHTGGLIVGISWGWIEGRFRRFR